MASAVERAKILIIETDLSPIEHRMLIENFIEKAYDPELAANEVLRRIEAAQDVSPEETLRGLKNDWHRLLDIVTSSAAIPASTWRLLVQRDGGQCCVTPKSYKHAVEPEPIYIISPSVLKLWEDDVASALRKLLDAFLTPHRTQVLLAMLSDTSDKAALSNLLLVSPSIALGLRNGHVEIRPLPSFDWKDVDDLNMPETGVQKYHLMPIKTEAYVEVYLADGTRLRDKRLAQRFSITTDNPVELPPPSTFLLKMMCKFTSGIRRFHIEKVIATPSPLQSSSFWGRSMQVFFRSLWHIIPTFLRTQFYRHMLARSRTKGTLPLVLPLPFGLYAKNDTRSRGNEPAALELLEKEAPYIPAPLLIDRFRDRHGEDWFVMTRLPGLPVANVLYRMSYPERHQLADDLSRVIDRMHAIPNTTPYLFASVSGGPIRDPRASAQGCGPYNNEVDFNAQISKGWQEALLREIPSAFTRLHKSVFTHSDLFFSNVLVDGGRLSGIIDWESAGFMPEYWEFTKAMLAVRLNSDAQEVYRRIWGHDYDDELRVQQWLVQVFPFGGPEEWPEEEAED